MRWFNLLKVKSCDRIDVKYNLEAGRGAEAKV